MTTMEAIKAIIGILALSSWFTYWVTIGIESREARTKREYILQWIVPFYWWGVSANEWFYKKMEKYESLEGDN